MKKVGAIMAGVGILNFVSFGIFCTRIGGSADCAASTNGKFFVSEHGKRTEVSEMIFQENRYHRYSLILTHPMAMLGIAIYGITLYAEKAAKQKL